MDESTRLGWLRIALRVVGILFVVGVYPLTVLWPSGWAWHAGQSHWPVQSLSMPEHAGHLLGDVPALFVIAGVLAILCPPAARLGATRAVA